MRRDAEQATLHMYIQTEKIKCCNSVTSTLYMYIQTSGLTIKGRTGEYGMGPPSIFSKKLNVNEKGNAINCSVNLNVVLRIKQISELATV